MGTLRGLFRFQNPDSTADLNLRFSGLVLRGVMDSGSTHTSGAEFVTTPVVARVPSMLAIDVKSFLAVAQDGMLVEHLAPPYERLGLTANSTQYVVVRAVYAAAGPADVGFEVWTTSDWTAMSATEKAKRIVLAKVTTGATSVVDDGDVDLRENDIVDKYGRYFIRGVVASNIELPIDSPTSMQRVQVGDVYLSIAERQFYRWDGSNWLTVTDQVVATDLLQHKSVTGPGTSAVISRDGVGYPAHLAKAISYAPPGGSFIVATNMQDALHEVDQEKVKKAGDTMSGTLAISTTASNGLTSTTSTSGVAGAFLSSGNSNAVNAVGAGSGHGVSAVGGATGRGVSSTGGGTQAGVYGVGGSGGAAGVEGLGGGNTANSVGVKGTGVAGTAGAAGDSVDPGGNGTAGSTGVYGIGLGGGAGGADGGTGAGNGGAGGTGGNFVGGAGGAGGTGGGTGGAGAPGVSAQGGAAGSPGGAVGDGVLGLAAGAATITGGGRGGAFRGIGTGVGVYGFGGNSSGTGVYGEGGTTDGKGGEFVGKGNGSGVVGSANGTGDGVTGIANGTHQTGMFPAGNVGGRFVGGDNGFGVLAYGGQGTGGGIGIWSEGGDAGTATGGGFLTSNIYNCAGILSSGGAGATNGSGGAGGIFAGGAAAGTGFAGPGVIALGNGATVTVTAASEGAGLIAVGGSSNPGIHVVGGSGSNSIIAVGTSGGAAADVIRATNPRSFGAGVYAESSTTTGSKALHGAAMAADAFALVVDGEHEWMHGRRSRYIADADGKVIPNGGWTSLAFTGDAIAGYYMDVGGGSLVSTHTHTAHTVTTIYLETGTYRIKYRLYFTVSGSAQDVIAICLLNGAAATLPASEFEGNFGVGAHCISHDFLYTNSTAGAVTFAVYMASSHVTNVSFVDGMTVFGAYSPAPNDRSFVEIERIPLGA